MTPDMGIESRHIGGINEFLVSKETVVLRHSL